MQQQGTNMMNPSLMFLRNDGSAWAVCGSKCAAFIMAYTKLEKIPTSLELANIKTPPTECLHCAWCRELIHLPDDCWMHGYPDNCPNQLDPLHAHPNSHGPHN